MTSKYVVLSLLIGIVAIASQLVLNKAAEPAADKKPNEWFFRQRAFPFEQINHQAYLKALKQAEQFQREFSVRNGEGNWEFAGPVNLGGRITDVEMHAADINTIYAGAAAGGVFKSIDKGANWSPIFDEALSLSIGDIAIAPSDANIIYVGTGEANAGGGSLAYDGVGVYRSDDAGETWTHKGLEESRSIGRMVVDPSDPNTVYVAAMGNLFADGPNRGIYKSADGGNTWENILYVSDSTGAIDVAINPTDPDILYAAMWERVRRPNRRSYGGATCGIFRSLDGGENWTELTNGLPTAGKDKGRIGIDISHSDPNILYAIYADSIGYLKGIYKTIDGGENWTQTSESGLSNVYASYGWWFGRIKIDPVNPNNTFIIGFDIYRTKNGGSSWSNQSNNVHVDQHAVYIHPLDNNFIVLGNDGGIYISENGGNTWKHDKTLPITQFYTCEADYQQPWRLYGGTQDNGTNRIINSLGDDWQRIYGGDGFYVLVDPVDNRYVYAESQYGGLGRSTNGGSSFYNATNGISFNDRFNWNCPLVFDPSNPEILYFGSNRLYKSTNRASSWSAISSDLTDGKGDGNIAYNTLTTISVSPVNNQLIYTGSDDGNVHVSEDGGLTFQNISAGLPKRWISRIAADPLDEHIVYVTVSGFRWNEYMPHVFRSEDYGQSWTDISGNLPEAPVNDIIINWPNNQTLFVATDVGVFATYDGGAEWNLLGTGMPNVVVTDLVLHKPTNVLTAATFGRSMYSYDLEQDQVTQLNNVQIELGISIYPNPFQERLVINISQVEGTKISINDMSGRLIKHIVPESKRILWDGKSEAGAYCPAGVYLCIISNGDTFETIKIIRK